VLNYLADPELKNESYVDIRTHNYDKLNKTTSCIIDYKEVLLKIQITTLHTTS
jgi:hypothetical protein